MSLELAKEVADELKEKEGVVGVLLTGSVAAGYADENSDIDFILVVDSETYEDLEEGGDMRREGEYIQYELKTLEEIENKLKGWRDEISLWVYSQSRVLHDPTGEVSELLSKYDEYPEDVWKDRLFDYWFHATGDAPYNSGQAIRRGDLVTASLYQIRGMEYYTALAFILNKSFVPYRKWRMKAIEDLPDIPDDHVSRVRKVVASGVTVEEIEDNQEAINKVMGYFEERLLETGVDKRKVREPYLFQPNHVPNI
ncbi:MAG: DUF4037 domain-containing protein [Halobacteria archaeon]|nr:DUF4037 domain-containing protein [Halobacteria archaeon]